jgi:hypothetical protein
MDGRRATYLAVTGIEEIGHRPGAGPTHGTRFLMPEL